MVERALLVLGCVFVGASASASAASPEERAEPLPDGAVLRIGTVRLNHADGNRCEFSPDGQRLLTAGFHGIRLWDAATGKPIREIKLDWLNFATFAADGKTIVACNDNPTGKGAVRIPQKPKVHVFDTETGKETVQFPLIDTNRDPFLVPQFVGRSGLSLVASGNADEPVILYDVTSGKEIRRLDSENAKSLRPYGECLQLSPNGKLLAGSSSKDVYYVFDTATGKELHRFTVQAKQTGESSTSDGTPILFSPDGKVLCSGVHEDSIYLWDLTTGKQLCRIKEFNQKDYPRARACFSPDGKLFCTWEWQAGVRLWQLPEGKLRHHFKIVRCSQALFSPNGALLAVNDYGCLHVIDLASGKELLKASSIFSGVCFSPDGTALAAVERDSGQPWAWQAPSFKPHEHFGGEHRGVESMILAVDGKSVTTWNRLGQFRRHDLNTGKEVARFALPEGQFRVAADGKLLAWRKYAHGVDEPFVLGDLARGKEFCRVAPQPADPGGWSIWREFALSPNSRFLAVASWGQNTKQFEIALHETAQGKLSRKLEILPLDADQGQQNWLFNTLVFSPDARTLAVIGSRFRVPEGGSRSKLYLWDVARGKKHSLVWGKHEADFILYSPDSRCMLLANQGQPARLLELTSGEVRCTFEDSADAGQSFAFSSDGKLLASVRKTQGLGDSPILLWDATTGRKLRSLPGHPDHVLSLAFTPDCKRLISGSADTTMLVWDVGELQRANAVPVGNDRIDACWQDLGKEAAKAHVAIRTLIQGSDQTVAFLQERLRPEKLPDLDRLVADLNADQFETREKAAQQLQKLGVVAVPALRKALDGKPSLELQQRAESILAKLDDTPSPGVLRDGRAIEVLEKIATDRALDVLEKLVKAAPGTPMSEDAQAALTRLKRDR